MSRPPSTGWSRMCCARSVLLHRATSTTSLCTAALTTDSAPSTYISGICARFREDAREQVVRKPQEMSILCAGDSGVRLLRQQERRSRRP
ncbi:hypothetical protein PF001_g32965 [Phytophthora fragariae]|uniref:Uncharacterized protein n=1 Tax=Phytophthora fragariae TaxID=53985 RepID=A0A6A4ARW1_9STRA|nr:hypothetical protein PF001_g32965 [Phytophthora fragariae]